MAAPVWVLSVDLQTKTASFTTGLAEASRSARSAFGDISSGAAGMGGAVAHSSLDVRHSLGLVDNVIRGAHAQAMADLVRMYARSAVVMAALPVAAAAAGLALVGGVAYEVTEHFRNLQKEAEKLNDHFTEMGTVVNTTFDGLDDDILKAEQKTDELRGDHLGALQKELQLIDHTSMAELVRAFGTIEKAADEVFKDLQGHWYTFGIGSDGAKHALDQFKTQYDSLLSQGKEGDASGLLGGTLQQAQKVQAALAVVNRDVSALNGIKDGADADKVYAAQLVLRQAGLTGTQKELEAQNALVQALQAQEGVEQRVNTLKKDQSTNATLEAHKKTGGGDNGARAAAESQMRINEKMLAAEKVTADARLTITRASIEQRLQSDYEFAGRERDIQMAGNAAEIAALDRSGKEYAVRLKELKDKALEITADYNAKVADLNAKASVEINARDVAALEQGEKEKIEATRQGSAARLAALDSAIREERERGLQDTSFARELAQQRIETIRQEAQEEDKLREQAAKEATSNTQKLAELQLQAERQAAAVADSRHRESIEARIAEETYFAEQEYEIKRAALAREMADVDRSSKDGLNKLKQLQDQEKQLTVAHENEIAAIREKAEIERNQRVLAANTQFENSIAAGLTRSIEGHQRWGQMVQSIGAQVVGGMIENAIKAILADDMTKEKDAAAAARKAYNIGLSIGGPAGVILGPIFGAAAFASVMAFEGGGVVPGVGRGDVVPAMLTPGEGVVPKGVMEGLSHVARNGGFQSQQPTTTHVHVSPTYHIQTIDGDGMKAALDKHSDQLHQHFQRAMRKMNR
jgi:hypothetical protein